MLKSSPHQNLEDYALKRLAESPLRVNSSNNYKEVIDNDPKPITDSQSSK